MSFLLFLFVLFCLFLFIASKRDVANLHSKSILFILLISIIINISLAQNYTNSQIPNDGIGISNTLAYLIITDDGWGRFWSVEVFRSAYNISTRVTIGLLILFGVTLLIDRDSQTKV